MDEGVTAAATAVLNAASNPDQALRAYQGEMERVLAENSDPQVANDLLHRSVLAALDSRTATTFAALERAVDGRMYSASFAGSSLRMGLSGATEPWCTESVDQALLLLLEMKGLTHLWLSNYCSG